MFQTWIKTPSRLKTCQINISQLFATFWFILSKSLLLNDTKFLLLISLYFSNKQKLHLIKYTHYRSPVLKALGSQHMFYFALFFSRLMVVSRIFIYQKSCGKRYGRISSCYLLSLACCSVLWNQLSSELCEMWMWKIIRGKKKLNKKEALGGKSFKKIQSNGDDKNQKWIMDNISK